MTAIFFDVDGTLLHSTREYREILARTFRSVENEVTDEWIDCYNEAFYELFTACEPNPVERAFARIEGCANPGELADALLENEVKSCQPPKNLHGDLRRLAETHDLGILTNGFPEWQLPKLEAHDLVTYFDAVVVSYEAGAHKPDTAPYRAAEDRLPAAEYVMVGDSDSDIEGAEKAGWDSHRYEGRGFGDLPEVLR